MQKNMFAKNAFYSSNQLLKSSESIWRNSRLKTTHKFAAHFFDKQFIKFQLKFRRKNAALVTCYFLLYNLSVSEHLLLQHKTSWA